MRTKASIPWVHRTSIGTVARRAADRPGEAASLALVAGWSVTGLALGLLETAGPRDLAAAVAEGFVVLCCVGLAALAGIVAAELRTSR
ncbi:MAG TPA: hypothetical protein VNE00_16520 [Paraburkholderia sp.]|jgi:hypothetical protein|nr:hypothetical protein [Paraburkholderia sp.]